MSLSKNALLAVLQVIVVGLVYFVLYRVLHATIGPEGLGVFSVVLATTSIGRLSGLGLTGSVVKFVARDLARGDAAGACRALDAARLGNGLFMGAVVLILWPIAWLLLPSMLEPDYVEAGRSILPAALASLWFGNQAGVFQSAVEALERFDLRARLVIASSLGYLALAVALVRPYGLPGLAIAQLGQSIALHVGMFLAARRGLGGLRVLPGRFDRTLFKELLGFGLRFQVMTLGTLMLEPVAKGLAAHFGGTAFSGYFEMANRMVTQLRQLINAAAQALVPAAARASELDPGEVEVLLRRSTTALTFVVFPALACTLVATPLIGELWIGHRVPLFEQLAWILAVGFYLGLLSSPAWFVNLGTGRLEGNTMATVAMIVVTAGSPFLLRPLFGAHSVAVAYSLAFIVGGLVIIRDSQVVRGRRLADAFERDSGPVIVGAVVATAAGLAVVLGLRDDHSMLSHALGITVFSFILTVPVLRHPLSRRLWARLRGARG